MSWQLCLGVACFIAALVFLRARSLKAQWAWSDVEITLFVGGSRYQVFVPELIGVATYEGQLIFETARGQLGIERRWVVEPFIHALATTCSLTDADLRDALATGAPFRLWQGAPGTFRFR